MPQRSVRPTTALTSLLALVLIASVWGCVPRQPLPQPHPAPPPPAYETQYVTAYRLNVRQEPVAGSHILAVLARGELVEILDRSGDWLLVRRPPQAYSDFFQGWVYGAYLTGYQDMIAPPRPKAPSKPTLDTEPQTPPSDNESGFDDANG